MPLARALGTNVVSLAERLDRRRKHGGSGAALRQDLLSLRAALQTDLTRLLAAAASDGLGEAEVAPCRAPYLATPSRSILRQW
jgi:hypothetical protein